MIACKNENVAPLVIIYQHQKYPTISVNAWSLVPYVISLSAKGENLRFCMLFDEKLSIKKYWYSSHILSATFVYFQFFILNFDWKITHNIDSDKLCLWCQKFSIQGFIFKNKFQEFWQFQGMLLYFLCRAPTSIYHFFCLFIHLSIHLLRTISQEMYIMWS